MNVPLRALFASALLVTTGRTSQAVAQPYRVGDRVVCIADAKLTVGTTTVDDVWPGLYLTVSDVNGKWLWVSNGHPGWLDQQYVIPLNRAAIDRLTAMLNANPSSRLYSGRASVWLALGELDIAIADFNEAIRLKPSSTAYNNRGYAWKDKGEYDRAIADYNEALRLDPKNATVYNNRGSAWNAKGEYDRAIAHLNQALRLDPTYAYAYLNLGIAWNGKGEYDRVLQDYRQALRLDPKDADAHNALAWFRATCPDERYRDGQEALSQARLACKLADSNAGFIDTLAACYAEAGDFAEAVATQQRAVDLAPADQKTDFRSRLTLYKQRKPYREPRKG